MPTAAQRLAKLLNESEARIADLEEALESAKSVWTWTKHREYQQGAEPGPSNLPVPRLEMRWSEQERDDDGYTLRAEYSLVYRHLLGHVVFVPLGLTRSTGDLARRLNQNGSIDMPFRDGAHLQNEMRTLGLRAFGILGNSVFEYVLCSHCRRVNECHREGEGFNATCSLAPVSDQPVLKHAARKRKVK